MNRRELFDELYKGNDPENTKKYSFEKTLSIIRLTKEYGEFEDKNVHVTMKRTPAGNIFNCEWKK